MSSANWFPCADGTPRKPVLQYSTWWSLAVVSQVSACGVVACDASPMILKEVGAMTGDSKPPLASETCAQSAAIAGTSVAAVPRARVLSWLSSNPKCCTR